MNSSSGRVCNPSLTTDQLLRGAANLSTPPFRARCPESKVRAQPSGSPSSYFFSCRPSNGTESLENRSAVTPLR